ncbi:MAG: hypothetical protein LBI79_10145 [Nitrososphaerota archaeon]|jgi:hypothetical protein|nr:hypothetical protein [Nitrososphaerota archaeon]
MKKKLRLGVIILIVGISLLVGTIYRSNTLTSFGNPRIDMAPNTWSYVSDENLIGWDGQTLLEVFEYLLAPREFQLEVQATAPVDVYVLDSKGISQWNKDKTVDYPVVVFKDVNQGIYTFELFKRDKYTIVLYNPTNENVTSRWNVSVYGIEKDLLYVSITIISTGLMVITLALMIMRKPFHKTNC